MVHSAVTHETGLDWPRNSGEMYLMTAPNATNRWGETRAYRILPGTGMGNPAHLTILNSTTLGRSASWSAFDFWVLKNHPTSEPASAHHLNYLQPLDPLVDFERMVDDEPIEEEDLVLYFNLGGHHVPSSQDVPNTLMHTSASSVMFVPFNYFDHDVSRAARQGVRVDRRRQEKPDTKPKEDVRVRVRHRDKTESAGDGISYFGARYTAPVVVDEAMLSPDLSHYMKEREDGQDDGDKEGEWVPKRNEVGGGLLGLFVGKERPQPQREDEKEKGRLDW
jgi:hypothetical protein